MYICSASSVHVHVRLAIQFILVYGSTAPRPSSAVWYRIEWTVERARTIDGANSSGLQAVFANLIK